MQYVDREVPNVTYQPVEQRPSLHSNGSLGILQGFLKGIYMGSIKGLVFKVSENRGSLFWGPCKKDPTI